MAKQSGLHQIRGKVGEHSYYKQTGVSSGLIRSINQGMSARVKTSEEYVNTRRNNAEFGQAGRLAAVLAQYIVPKYRPMLLPFSQSKMAKIILENIKNDTVAPWGQRNIVPADSGEMQVAALNSVAKNRFEDFGLLLTIDEENVTLTLTISDETVLKLSAIGADGFDYRFVATGTWIGKYSSDLRNYAPSIPRANFYNGDLIGVASGDSEDISYVIPSAPVAAFPAFAAIRTGLFIILPYRSINGQKHTLQEHCTFKAFVIADGDVH